MEKKSEDCCPNLESSMPMDCAKITDPVDPMRSGLPREHDQCHGCSPLAVVPVCLPNGQVCQTLAATEEGPMCANPSLGSTEDSNPLPQ